MLHLEFTIEKFEGTGLAVSTAVLVGYINDKCAQVRRKLKNKVILIELTYTDISRLVHVL